MLLSDVPGSPAKKPKLRQPLYSRPPKRTSRASPDAPSPSLLRPYLSGLDGVGNGLEARSWRRRLEEEEAKQLYEEAVGVVSSEEVSAEMPDGRPNGRKELTSAYT